MKPQRIQLSRRKGFRLAEVSRALNGLPARAVTRPGIYGNPYRVGQHGTAAECVTKYRADIERTLSGPVTLHQVVMRQMLRDIRGHNLACHCKPGNPCHADVLLDFANRPEKTRWLSPENLEAHSQTDREGIGNGPISA